MGIDALIRRGGELEFASLPCEGTERRWLSAP